MTKSRIFLWMLISFIGGVAIQSFFAVPYSFLLMWCVLAGIFISVGVMQKKNIYIVFGFLLVTLVAGIVRFDIVSMRLLPNPAFLGDHEFRGVLDEEPKHGSKAQTFLVAVHEIDGEKQRRSIAVLVTTAKYPEYSFGDEVTFSGLVKTPENFSDFDYGAYLKGRNISMVSAFPAIEKIGEEKNARSILFRIKRGIEEKIDILFSDPYGALLKGLLLGERSLLPEAFLSSLAVTGTTHIVALSGYNITLVGATVLSFLLFCSVPYRSAFWVASGFIVLFVIMTGASASVVRAGIMGLLLLIAQNEGRSYRMTNALVFAASLMILYNPMILSFDVGFQLSFLATCGVLYLSPKVALLIARAKGLFYRAEKRKALEKDAGIGRGETILTETLSAQCLVLPLLLFHFGTISFISPIVNIVVLVVVPFAMGLGFFSVVAGFLWMPLGHVVSMIAWFPLAYIVYAIEWFSRLPYASYETGVMPWYLLAASYGAIVVWIVKNKRSNNIQR